MGKRVGVQAYNRATRLIGERRCKKKMGKLDN